MTTSEPPKKLVIKKIPPIERKPQIALKSVTNSEGEIFQCQDQIRIKAPWGSRATAEITVLYQDESGNPWAQYKPNESDPKWDWEGGCIRAERLRKA
ncbi:MAG: hypothetical protein F6J90_14275 [Moorea sp. SIOASIH]|uniref:hypothetical protein n=1 Tax=Moorena sp. SIOASIH TaxID=2607817 RepID=UPI0013B75BDC|nr:hypothetical protein [Moorena sp. SIOASIH]NEO37429.1 hypothetical protein [Moorena sp. SIOASIH]